jgi:hypothetical protein
MYAGTSSAEGTPMVNYYYELPQFAPILSFIDAVFAELNTGLLIYHAEDLEDPLKLRLIYANRQASECTGTDLGNRIGKMIGEAFPPLAETDVPAIYLRVVTEKKSTRLADVTYEDDVLKKKTYSVRSFPMPADCVGIMFDDVEVLCGSRS